MTHSRLTLPGNFSYKGTMVHIVEIVSELYGVTPQMVKGHSHEARIVAARHVAAYCIRELTGNSLPMIGRFLGGKHHTSILHGCSRVAWNIENNPKASELVKQALEAITGNDPTRADAQRRYRVANTSEKS